MAHRMSHCLSLLGVAHAAWRDELLGDVIVNTENGLIVAIDGNGTILSARVILRQKREADKKC